MNLSSILVELNIMTEWIWNQNKAREKVGSFASLCVLSLKASQFWLEWRPSGSSNDLNPVLLCGPLWVYL